MTYFSDKTDCPSVCQPHPTIAWTVNLAAFLMAICLSIPAALAETTTFPDLQSILDQKKLRVGLITRDIPPFVITAKDGTLSGVDIRIAKGLAKRLGVAPEFVRTADTTDALIQQIAKGDVDIAISFISRSVGRAMQVYFSRPYLTEHVAFAMNRRVSLQGGVDCPESPDDLNALAEYDWKIGAQRGTIFEKVLKDRGLQKSMGPVR